MFLFLLLRFFLGFSLLVYSYISYSLEEEISNLLLEKAKQDRILKDKLQILIQKSSLPLEHMGIVISDVLPNGESFLLNINGERLFIPASLSKIITASAVYHYFAPFHQFETSFMIDAPIEGSTLKGPLYLKGGGDPSFVSEKLWILVNNFMRLNIKKIEGPLILDDTLFDLKKSIWTLLPFVDRSYNAPLSALSFNWNSVNIYIQSGLILHSPAKVYLDPENSYVRLKNNSKTKGKKRDIHVKRIKTRSSEKGDIISVAGSIPLGHPEFVVYKNISNPALWTGHNAFEFLRRRGIEIQQGIKKGKVPDFAEKVAQVKGRNIYQLVRDMMKYSSNFIAETLIVHLSLIKGKKRAKFNEGLRMVHQYLDKMGIKKYNFVQPSGLSRKNRLKPVDILNILVKDEASFYSAELISSYALARGDGTLRKRFQNVEHPSFIRAKTGWLNGVVGLGGYAVNKKRRKRAFIFIYNGSRKKQMKAQRLFDSLAQELTL